MQHTLQSGRHVWNGAYLKRLEMWQARGSLQGGVRGIAESLGIFGDRRKQHLSVRLSNGQRRRCEQMAASCEILWHTEGNLQGLLVEGLQSELRQAEWAPS